MTHEQVQGGDRAPGVRLDDPVVDTGELDVCSRVAPVERVLDWVEHVAVDVPLPGSGRTPQRWRWLATLAAWDLGQARVAEPHLDALAVLDEIGDAAVEHAGTWGVWAAEGPGMRLTARPTDVDGSWRLDGEKPWCSLAGSVSHALVSAWLADDGAEPVRALFAVETGQPGVEADAAGWHSHGLGEVVTSTTRYDGARARRVGEPNEYLTRPGFSWGGMGVAAVWFGGAVGLMRRLLESTGQREPDQVALVHVGAVDARLAAAGGFLERAAERVDAGAATGAAGARLAAQVRQVVADAAEEVLWRCAHALGPGVLTGEPEHAKRVADLEVYLRQHHAERDTAGLGRLVVETRGVGR